MTEQDVTAVIAALTDVYPSQTVKPETITAYAKAMADLDPAELRDVAARHVANEKWFPTVAELRIPYFQARLGLVSAQDAWMEVTEHIRLVPAGTGRVPEWSSEAVGASLKAVGGLAKVRMDERPAIVAAQFMRAYEAARAAMVEDANVASLTARVGASSEVRETVAHRAAVAAIEAAP